jgi:hypothetical protein
METFTISLSKEKIKVFLNICILKIGKKKIKKIKITIIEMLLNIACRLYKKYWIKKIAK